MKTIAEFLIEEFETNETMDELVLVLFGNEHTTPPTELCERCIKSSDVSAKITKSLNDFLDCVKVIEGMSDKDLLDHRDKHYRERILSIISILRIQLANELVENTYGGDSPHALIVNAILHDVRITRGMRANVYEQMDDFMGNTEDYEEVGLVLELFQLFLDEVGKSVITENESIKINQILG